ncbi:hypothetical protein QFC19_004190 [Naganishia cerealis]|uniref:Uncharacterized protein n=1 Tax=Naganishia cerealis TaxID=610337 RepID=A0ACC2VZ29_9TREE|nr:hypothetical protein QFC19_004190 [Naganishia cerealis]
MTSHPALITSPLITSTPPRRYSGCSSVSATTPNTASSQQSSPFHFAEFQTEIGTLQQRLIEERSRRSSGHPVKRTAETSERIGNTDRPETEAGNSTSRIGEESYVISRELHDGTTSVRPVIKHSSSNTPALAESDPMAVEHLREARQELQAVIEEALEESCEKMESIDNGTFLNLEDAQIKENMQTVALRDDDAQTTQFRSTDNPDGSHLLVQGDEISVALASSPLVSPPASSPISDSADGGLISFEDLVRHQRRNSDSSASHAPLFSPGARSHPTSPSFPPMRSRAGSSCGSLKDGMPSRSRHASILRSPTTVNNTSLSPTPIHISGASQLTKIRRTFSSAKVLESQSKEPPQPEMISIKNVALGNGAGARILSPASILSAAEAASPTNIDGLSATFATKHSADVNTQDSKIPPNADEQEARVPTDQLTKPQSQPHSVGIDYAREPKMHDALYSDFQQQDSTDQPESDQLRHHDTHLWDSVWPSAASNTSSLNTLGHVPYPKPISDVSPALTPRFPIHSRTMSQGYGSVLVHHATMPTHTEQKVPLVHSLSTPRSLSSRPNPPALPYKAPSYNSGIPLSFSSQLTQTSLSSAWPQGPSARRGSIASLGLWPLNKNVNAGGSGRVMEENAEKIDTAGLMEQESGDVTRTVEDESECDVRAR